MDAIEPSVEPVPKKPRTYPKPTRESKLVTLNELCTLLGLPVAWVKRMSQHGSLPCAKIGHRVLYNVEAVRTHLAKFASKPLLGSTSR